jgi:aspartate/methionine/tyrosine aminotransferase
MAALTAGDKIVDRNRAIIKQNIKEANRFFERWRDLFEWRSPAAGSVALVGVEVPSATTYCHELAREAGVLLLPSTFLGYDDRHVRFGFGRVSFADALAHYDGYLREQAL